MIKLPEASQGLSEAGIRANIEYLMLRQAKRLSYNRIDGYDIEIFKLKLWEIENEEKERTSQKPV